MRQSEADQQLLYGRLLSVQSDAEWSPNGTEENTVRHVILKY